MNYFRTLSEILPSGGTLSDQATADFNNVVNSFIEQAPILAGLPLVPTNNGMSHIVEFVVNADALKESTFDGGFEILDSNTAYKTFDLKIYKGSMFYSSDSAIKLSPDMYFAKKMAMEIPATGVKFEQEIIKNIREFVLNANKNVIDALGNANNNYSVYAVNWERGITHGLYDKDFVINNGGLFSVSSVGSSGMGDVEVAIPTVDPKITKTGYMRTIKSFWGLQLGNDERVGMIKNIDLSSTTSEELVGYIADLLLRVRTTGSTVLYMRPEVLNLLRAFKTERLVLTPADMNINRSIISFDGTPIVTSYNLPKGEANV